MFVEINSYSFKKFRSPLAKGMFLCVCNKEYALDEAEEVERMTFECEF